LLLLGLILTACTHRMLEGNNTVPATGQKPVSWFRTDSDHLLMRTQIDMMKKHFSGLMVIKALPDEGYRLIFLTEVGLKIFDMEFSSGKLVQVHYMLDAMNKKVIVKTLSGDLGMMLMPVDPVQMSRSTRKVRVDYYSGNGIRLDSVNISHYHVKLKIRLSQITENADHAAE
jgi:hypothetical protein